MRKITIFQIVTVIQKLNEIVVFVVLIKGIV
jgi:hypothetical protein